MSKAVESIVRGYVLLENRRALEALLTHRQKLLDGLNRVSAIDPNQVVTVIRDEIAIIQEGLERLVGNVAGTPESTGLKVLRVAVSEALPTAEDGVSTLRDSVEAATVAERIPQPRAGKAEVELGQPTPKPGQENTAVKVVGLSVSLALPGHATTVSPVPATLGAVGGLDPGSFALCTPSSNSPMQVEEEYKKTERPPN